MRSLLLVILFAGLSLNALFCADNAPTKMTHLIAQMSGPDIAPDSFAAKPKIMWRASNQYCRIDEEPDPEHGIHGKIIINEPDVWMVNLADSTARHIVDPGPTFNCKLPIFAFGQEMLKTKIADLEFGHEMEFLRKNGAQKADGPKLSFEVNYYELQIDDWHLGVVEIAKIHAPLTIMLTRGDKQYVVKYLLWDDQVPIKVDLFAKPSGVKIEEAK
jgi:hypothetical protein